LWDYVPFFIPIKMNTCKQCQKKFQPKYSSVEMFCRHICAIEHERKKERKKNPALKRSAKPIKKRSEKRAKQERTYSVDRKEFLSRPENKFCFIEGCGQLATTVEHRRGRVGYADKWAFTNNIPLLLDSRFWAGCCWHHNLQLENDPKLSKKYQFSKIHGGRKT